MMKILLLMIFMIPTNLSICMVLSQYSYMFMYLYTLFSGCFSMFNKISYFFGFDMFSCNLFMLSLLISSFMLISMFKLKENTMFSYVNLLMSLFLLVIFSSLSFIYMYMSFEFILVPLMILIMGWGYQPERLLAGMYLFFYTVVGSFPLLILIMYMYMVSGSMFFDYMIFYSSYFYIHFFLTLVFMVKLPMYFVHFWLPKAHVQAPVSGSMILAGLMLKIGGYGLIRTMYMYEYMFIMYSYFWFCFSMVGSVMISMVCFIQADMKCMIAYSSVSHMGMVIMGMTTMNSFGLYGAFLLMLGHGFCSSGLFYLSNLIYLRTSSRSFYINKGLMMYMPSCSIMMFLYCIFNMSCPPSINFISELLILMSSLSYWPLSMCYFFLISFFCACFSYYLYSFSQHGLFHNLYSFSPLNSMEFLCLFLHLLPLVGLSFMLSMLF